MGTMAFGSDADAAEAARMFRAARDAGINFFDTADQYNAGKSEEILGELIRGSRDDLVIATKCFNPTGKDVNARGANRRHVRRAVEASLKRLGTDRVDVLFLHHYDALTPLEEHMRALEDVVRDGKVLYPAVSNYSAWQTQAALGYQERNGWAPLQVIQPMYSLVKRQAEVELLPMAQANGVGVVAYSPSGGGLLSGRYAQPGAQGPPHHQQDVQGALRRRMDARDRGQVRRLLQGARMAPDQRRGGLGRVASRHHRADHRRAQPGADARFARRGEDRDDARAARRDRRALAHAAAGDRPVRRGRQGLSGLPRVVSVEARSVRVTARTVWTFARLVAEDGSEGWGEASLEGRSAEVEAAIRAFALPIRLGAVPDRSGQSRGL